MLAPYRQVLFHAVPACAQRSALVLAGTSGTVEGGHPANLPACLLTPSSCLPGCGARGARLQVAAQYGVTVPEGKVGEMMKPADDVVAYDLLLVMDKVQAHTRTCICTSTCICLCTHKDSHKDRRL